MWILQGHLYYCSLVETFVERWLNRDIGVTEVSMLLNLVCFFIIYKLFKTLMKVESDYIKAIQQVQPQFSVIIEQVLDALSLSKKGKG